MEKRLKELGVDVKITPDLSGLKGVEVEIKTDTSKVINEVQAQLQQLNAIAANTLANANAAQEIRELFAGVITTGSGGRAIKIK